MNNLQNLKNIIGDGDSKSLYNQQRNKAIKLQKKWEKTGLLKNLVNESEKHSMAFLLENQAIQLIKESTQTGNVQGSEEWSGVALPLVRKVFGEIAAKEFVSVQPMNLPSGLVFFLEFKYGNTKLPFEADSSIYGDTESAGDPTGGLYGAGRYSYSVNQVTASAAGVTGSVTWADVKFRPDLSASFGNMKKVIINSSSIDSAYDQLAVRSFDVVSGSTLDVYPEFTSINSDGSTLTFIVTGSGIVNSTFDVHYSKQPIASDRGDFEYRSNATIGTNPNEFNIPELNLEFNSKPIVAKTRKLKASWTPEIAQDLMAYQSVDAEAELTNILSENISKEIDLEILDMLITNAATTEYWSADPGVEYRNSTWSRNSNYVISNKTEWYNTLGIKMSKLSNAIHQKTMRGGANFAVVSPTIATIFESMNGYNAKAYDKNGMKYAMGVEQVGVINNKIDVYKNPYMLENQILVGFRGSSFLETGAVFAPYIPLIMTPLIYDPNTLVPRKGIMTRYGKIITRKSFYGKIIVQGLDTV